MKRFAIVLSVILSTLVFAACGHPTDEGLVFHTADPNLSILLIVPQGPVPPVEPEVVPAEEVGEVTPDPKPEPPCEVIKGNISRDGRKLYHAPGMPNYDQVKIDEAAGEAFFCSIEEAEAEGWTRAGG